MIGQRIAWSAAPRMVGAVCVALLVSVAAAHAQQGTGRITGVVKLTSGDPLHGATIIVLGPGKTAITGNDGTFAVDGLAPGTYEIIATREHLETGRQDVTVTAESATQVEFTLALSALHEEVTVTASLGAATAYEAFNAVDVVDSFELAKNMAGTIGEVLEGQAGVARRSFGAGNSRPIIRGFDGDRVLILENGMRSGDLSSQSGDHGVSIDPAGLDRLEVVRGPATLLYGSNAIGGVVNAITPHEVFETSPTEGVHGQIVSDFGTANRQAGANASVHVGREQWNVWAGGGSRRTGDYETPEGPVENSDTRLTNGRAGFGVTGARAFFSLGVQAETGTYGIPFAGLFEGEEDAQISLDTDRQVIRADLGGRNLAGAFNSVRVITNFTRWRHSEIETEDGASSVGTRFANDVLGVRAEATQRPRGRLSGKIGVSTERRAFNAVGEEALAPKTTQLGVAGFLYEELDFGSARVQFGARVEHNAYSPDAREDADVPEDEPAPPDAVERDFTGFSGSAGVHVDLGGEAALVVNLSRAYRAPALEELYNFGPHVGNLAFEIGNPNLEHEASTGIDVSLRSRETRVRGEVNVFYYRIGNFVFPAFTGDELDGLRVAEYQQGDSRFMGFDASSRFEVAPRTWLGVTFGYVNAELTDLGTPLPRIPPFHANIDLGVPIKSITLTPEVELRSKQSRVYDGETETAGSAILNLSMTYVVTRAHLSHVFSVRGYNLTNETYRSHTSFIKDLAPELGRGVKASYSVRFF